ncbi:ATP-binding protein [Halalkalibacillus halophilus]|uniref:ATP-binding protein n=1 Tax=Halalkalibacillus halophilus TaxID=392827 RepID=UPI00040BD968|nr:ATP-binding protein [Halalkalibacillus halophilus]
MENLEYTYVLQSPQQYHHIRERMQDKLLECFSNDQMLIDLAIYEAVTNAWRHGHHKLEHKNIIVEIKFLRKSLLVRVCDEGEGFKVPEHFRSMYNQFDRPAEEQLESGRGILIMQQVMDKVIYSFKGNDLILRKWYPTDLVEGV